MKRADLTTVIIRKEIDIEGEDYGGGGASTPKAGPPSS